MKEKRLDEMSIVEWNKLQKKELKERLKKRMSGWDADNIDISLRIDRIAELNEGNSEIQMTINHLKEFDKKRREMKQKIENFPEYWSNNGHIPISPYNQNKFKELDKWLGVLNERNSEMRMIMQKVFEMSAGNHEMQILINLAKEKNEAMEELVKLSKFVKEEKIEQELKETLNFIAELRMEREKGNH